MSTPQSQTALAAQPKPTLTQELASHYGIEPSKFIATLKATVMPKRQGGEPVAVSDEELAAFCMVAREYGLNPFLKEIYAFPNKFGGITPIVGVDGWAKMMNRKTEFDGIEFELKDDDNGKPHSVTAHVWIKGRSRTVSITEYFSECQRGTDMWRQMPRRMLRHKALIQAARVAFGFSGIHDEDEANDMVNVTPPAAREKKPLFVAPKREAIPAVEVPTATPEPAAQVEPEPEQVAPEPDTEVLGPSPLDEKRMTIRDAFEAAGMQFDHLKAFLANRNLDLGADETDFIKLSQGVCDRLTRSSDSLKSFVAQAKKLAGGAK